VGIVLGIVAWGVQFFEDWNQSSNTVMLRSPGHAPIFISQQYRTLAQR
jgi:hypothetical protein